MSEAERIAKAIKEIEESGLGGNQVHEETLRTALTALRAQEQNEPLSEVRDIEVCVLDGVEGPCIVLNGTRIAGPKPWGGARVSHQWETSLHEISNAIKPRAKLYAHEPKGAHQ